MNLLSSSSFAAIDWSSPDFQEKLILVGAIGVVLLPVLVWAVFIRKRRRRRSHHHHPSTHARLRSSRSHDSSEHKHRRRRRRHHQHRNPTRAETGGLPPARSQEPQETAA